MIILNSIKLKDFLSHEETELTFKEDEKLLVDGVSGSGKSSIVEALVFALYGIARTDNRNLIRRGCKTSEVTIQLDNGQSKFNITRSISSSGKHTLQATRETEKDRFVAVEKTGLKDIQNWIEKDLLKASYTLFINSIASPQNNEDNFIKASASRRKDLLLEIVHASDIDEWYEKARVALSKEELVSRDSSIELAMAEKVIVENQTLASNKDNILKDIKVYEDKINESVEREKSIKESLDKVSGLERDLQEKDRECRRITLDIQNRRIDIQNLRIQLFDPSLTDINAARKYAEMALGLSTEISQLEEAFKTNSDLSSRINEELRKKPTLLDNTSDIERLNKQLIPLIKDSGKCPSGDACPFVIPIKAQISFFENQIKDKVASMEASRTAYKTWEDVFNALPQPKDTTEDYRRNLLLKNELKEAQKSQTVVDKYEGALVLNKTLEENIAKLAEKNLEDDHKWQLLLKDKTGIENQILLAGVSDLKSEVLSIQNTIKRLSQGREELLKDHVLSVKAHETIEKSQKEVVRLKKDLKTSKEKQENLSLLKEAFGAKGIKAVVVDYMTPMLEERINDILSQLSDFRIRLDTQQSKVKEEDGVKEGLWITVRNDRGEELPLENLSGGETVKVSMAISEALASLGNSVGFRILDEAVNSLDSESTQSFVEVLLKLQEKFPQVLCISHLPEVKDIFEKKLTCVKRNGVSTLTPQIT